VKSIISFVEDSNIKFLTLLYAILTYSGEWSLEFTTFRIV